MVRGTVHVACGGREAGVSDLPGYVSDMNSGIIALSKIGAEAGPIALRHAISRALFHDVLTTVIAPQLVYKCA